MTNGGTNGHGDLCNCEGCQWLYRFSVSRDVPHLPVVQQAESGKVCKCGVPLQTKTALRTGLCRECRDKGETYGLGEPAEPEMAGGSSSPGTWKCRMANKTFTPDLNFQPPGKDKPPEGKCWCSICHLYFSYPKGTPHHFLVGGP